MPMVMIDMKQDPERRKLDSPTTCCEPTASDKPSYPYGLSISFNQETLEKLKLDIANCAVGGIMHLHCLARITGMNANDYGDGMDCRVELQIESMAVESEDAENEEAAAKPKTRRVRDLYADAE